MSSNITFENDLEFDIWLHDTYPRPGFIPT